MYLLSVSDVRQIHADTLAHEGGLPGVRDLALLESATQTAAQQFGGVWLHEGFATKAAAYLFHLASNHPFFDGNKRVGALSALVFLRANRIALPAPERLEPVVWAVAEGAMTKQELTEWFREQLGETAPEATDQ